MSYADKFHITLEEEKSKVGKPADVMSVDELAEILVEFDPLSNKKDRKLVNFLAGRKIPEKELN